MEIHRIFDFIYYQAAHFPQEKAISVKKDGQWVSFSTDRIIRMANQLSRGLWQIGVRPGDTIGLVSYQNCPEWVICDLAMLQIGAVSVPVYPTISSGEYEYIFNDAEVKYVFVGGGDLFHKVNQAMPKIPTLKEIFTLEKQENGTFWETIFTDDPTLGQSVEEVKAAVKPSQLATLIYTSGTTGYPKGVMLSHENVVVNILTLSPVIPGGQGDRALSFLPLCHIFERAATFAYFYTGINIYQTGTDNLGGEGGDLRAVRPHFFTAVPRLLEKVYEKIYNKGLELKGLKKLLFFWALRLTDDYEYGKQYTGWAKWKRKIADRLIFSKWREALGGCVKGIFTGSAACPVMILRVFSAAGIPIREGYGLTEASPGISANEFKTNKCLIGSVGPIIDCVEVRLDRRDENFPPGEGEVLCTGPGVMMGYYKKPDETAETIIDIDGKRWLRTGDVGTFIDGPEGLKYLKITDRIKELLKTSGGKYVAPGPIETKLKEDFMIEQVMVVGELQKFVSALIVPTEEALKSWCQHHDIPWTNLSEMLKHPKVIEKYQRLVDQYNPLFNHIEQIKKFVLVPDVWEPTKKDGSEAELTPTMKLKRRVILRKYRDQIASMYA